MGPSLFHCFAEMNKEMNVKAVNGDMRKNTSIYVFFSTSRGYLRLLCSEPDIVIMLTDGLVPFGTRESTGTLIVNFECLYKNYTHLKGFKL